MKRDRNPGGLTRTPPTSVTCVTGHESRMKSLWTSYNRIFTLRSRSRVSSIDLVIDSQNGHKRCGTFFTDIRCREARYEPSLNDMRTHANKAVTGGCL
ncbi:hypothetical protein JOB18_048401 [Solea senegalensis]|uniref:Uncharacterized protein n=1 Tax=Solea senegalensis TaxID=28829 RepID=A0AAV6SNG9_SOLSE|nr:hypothetical protein JOB18_048401 [Solea senegalensis]